MELALVVADEVCELVVVDVADGEAVRVMEGVPLVVCDAVADEVAVAEAVADGEGVHVAVSVVDAVCVAVAVGEALPVGEGDGDGEMSVTTRIRWLLVSAMYTSTCCTFARVREWTHTPVGVFKYASVAVPPSPL